MIRIFGKKKKYRYRVGLHAEGKRTGYLDLTEKEARLVAYATNPENWISSFYGEYYGEFRIDLDNPMEIK